MVHDTCVYRERAMVKLHVRCSAMLKQNPTAFRNVISLQKLHLILFVKRCLKNFGLEASGLDFCFVCVDCFAATCFKMTMTIKIDLRALSCKPFKWTTKSFLPHFSNFCFLSVEQSTLLMSPSFEEVFKRECCVQNCPVAE